ncbi:MAG: ATP-binding protein [bacterium]|nr:ATP-binding protein [bacterium]
MLRFLRDVAEKRGECDIIFLDCVEKADSPSEESENITDNLIFNQPLSREAKGDLFAKIKDQLPRFIVSLEGLCSNFSERAERLLEGINRYLSKMLERTLHINNGKIYISNSSTGEANILAQEVEVLSPGERNIIIFSLALLYIQANVNKPSLLLIDEIETHLHPAVLQELFKMFRENLKDVNCCVFIATHSVFLLPEFEFEEICYFEQGELKKVSGTVYQDIMNTLVYGKDGNHSISELLVSVDSWSYAEYMAECFQRPTVSERVKADDPQYLKMKQVVKELLEHNGGEELQVLDFGAGEARIGMCMKMDYESRPAVEWPKIKYHVYDKYVKVTDKFVSGEFVFGKKFESEEAVAALKGQMDIVLLYNVLHEIGVDEWCKELNLILSLLKENGVLVFSERKTLSVGERPFGKSGYLLLGKEEIDILFSNMEVEEIELEKDMRRNTWGFAIRNVHGKSITDLDVEKAIERLTFHTQDIVEEYYRQEETDSFKARDYAFYCQQYFNAREAMNILKNKSVSHMKLQFILSLNRSSEEKRELLQMRAEIDDEEGRKCKRHLQKNPV